MSEKASWIATYDEKDRCIKLAEYLIDNNSTVRATAKHFGISKSTVHKDLVDRLPKLNKVLADEVRKVLDENQVSQYRLQKDLYFLTFFLFQHNTQLKIQFVSLILPFEPANVRFPL